MGCKSLRRMILVACCAILVEPTSGCSRWVELMAVPESTQAPAAHIIAKSEQVPLVLDHVSLTRNGAPMNPPLDTEQRLLGSLKDIGLFSRSASIEPAQGEKVVRARVLYDEALDLHAGSAAWKGIVIGASMFILAPFIPLDYDYTAHVTLELERWDGQVKRYESQSAGIAHFQLFGATPLMVDELKGHVTESCFTALMHQVVHDTSFYTASSAPLQENAIRSVSVKTRRSNSSGAPAVPISAPSGR